MAAADDLEEGLLQASRPPVGLTDAALAREDGSDVRADSESGSGNINNNNNSSNANESSQQQQAFMQATNNHQQGMSMQQILQQYQQQQKQQQQLLNLHQQQQKDNSNASSFMKQEFMANKSNVKTSNPQQHMQLQTESGNAKKTKISQPEDDSRPVKRPRTPSPTLSPVQEHSATLNSSTGLNSSFMSDPNALLSAYFMQHKQQQNNNRFAFMHSLPSPLSPPSAGGETPSNHQQKRTSQLSPLSLDGSGLHAMSVAAAQAASAEEHAQTAGSLGLEAPPLHGNSPFARRSSVFAGSSAALSPSQQMLQKLSARRPSLPPSFKMPKTAHDGKVESGTSLLHMQALADAAAAAAEVTGKHYSNKENQAAAAARAAAARAAVVATAGGNKSSLPPALSLNINNGNNNNNGNANVKKESGSINNAISLHNMTPLDTRMRAETDPTDGLNAMSRIASAPNAATRRGSTKSKRRNSARQAGKTCHFQGCEKLARSTTLFCAAHGGGRRCHADGCTKSARGATNYCIAHGGGRRCQAPDCRKSAQGSTDFCIAHGGGRRCKHDLCDKSARGPTGFCKAHGGGKRCSMYYCYKSAVDGSEFCKNHYPNRGLDGSSVVPGSVVVPQPQHIQAGASTSKLTMPHNAGGSRTAARRSSVNSIASNFSSTSAASEMSNASYQQHPHALQTTIQ